MLKPMLRILVCVGAIGGLLITGSSSRALAGGGGVYTGYSAHFGGYPHYGGRYHVGYRHGFHKRHFRRHHRGGHGGDILIGLGAGLLLYHVIDQANDRRSRYYGDSAYGPSQHIYRNAEPPRYTPRPGPVPSRTTYQESNCRQTREYQTTITIGGEEKEAYGTACLQADGSWLMGPPQPVPDFE